MVNPISLFRAWLWLNEQEKLAVKEVIVDNQTKPGYKTTEFWMTLLMNVPAVLGLFIGASNPITLAIGGVATVAYTLSRAWSKGNATAVAMAALQAAADKAKELPAPAPAGPVTPK